MLPAETLQEGK